MSDPLGLIPPGASGPIQPLKPPTPGMGRGAGAPVSGPSFKDVLMKNLQDVNALQSDAQVAIEDLATGKRDDMAAVMTAKQKADVAFKMLLQVRNKMMDAYEEVKQIRV